MSENMLAELTDIAMRIKESFEDKDIERFGGLFLPTATINSMGRFYSLQEFLALLKELLAHLEQPALDILQIQESKIGKDQAFVSFLVESGWIDSKTWEERTQRVVMSLQLAKGKKGWGISGLTLTNQPAAKDDFDDGSIRPDPIDKPPAGSSFGLDGLFSFWY